MDAVRQSYPEAQQPPRTRVPTCVPTSSNAHITTEAKLIDPEILFAERTAFALEYQRIDKFLAIRRIRAQNLGFKRRLLHLFQGTRLLHPARPPTVGREMHRPTEAHACQQRHGRVQRLRALDRIDAHHDQVLRQERQHPRHGGV